MRKDSGSLLVVALVAVHVVTALVLSLAAWMRAQAVMSARGDLLREGRRRCRQGAAACCFERLLADTNRHDSLDEPWAGPYEKTGDGWTWRVSANGWAAGDGQDTGGLVDEAGRIPVNKAPAALLSALLGQCGLGEDKARELAGRIVARREESPADGQEDGGAPGRGGREPRETTTVRQTPGGDYLALGELADVPGMTPEVLAIVAPCLTVMPVERVNINTAPDAVLAACLGAGGGRGSAAAAALLGRIRAFRHDGRRFDSADPAAVARRLGHVSAEESMLLAAIATNVCVRSDLFSGVVEASPAGGAAEAIARPTRAAFTYDRAGNRFLRWVEE